MVAGPGSIDPYEALARKINDLEAALEEQGRRAIPDSDVPMYPKFVPDIAASSGGGFYWTTFDVADGTERDCWEGRIGEVWHPTLYVDGVWGYVFLPAAGTATYRAYVNNDLVGTWTEVGGVIANQGPFDISPYLRQKNIGVRVTIQASTNAGTNPVYVALLGCLQRRQ